LGLLQRYSLEWKTPYFISALIKVGQNPLQEKVELFSAEPVEAYDDSEIILDYGEKVFLDKIALKDIIKDLGFGWNLDNTFDDWNSSQNQGLDFKTCWGISETSLALKGLVKIFLTLCYHGYLLTE
jgi:hypothetical protein